MPVIPEEKPYNPFSFHKFYIQETVNGENWFTAKTHFFRRTRRNNAWKSCSASPYLDTHEELPLPTENNSKSHDPVSAALLYALFETTSSFVSDSEPCCFIAPGSGESAERVGVVMLPSEYTQCVPVWMALVMVLLGSRIKGPE